MDRCSTPTRCSDLRLAGLLAAAVLALAGCHRNNGTASKPVEEEEKPLTSWPTGTTGPLKISDELVIAIPLEYERAAIHHGKATRALLFHQSDRAEAQFDFFLPDYSGYTLQNYQNDADPRRVEVVYLHAGDPHEAEADAPGEYPPNMLKRAMQDLDPASAKDMYRLKCYKSRVLSDRLTCYGKRDAKEDILLYVKVPPYAPEDTFPVMQARYFSKRYGGVRIAWRAHVDNLPHWRDIDAQIWRFIDTWKLEPAAPTPPAPPAPATPSPSTPPPQRQ